MVIPAPDGTEPLASRFSTGAVAGAAAGATTPLSWPQGPRPSWRRTIRTTTVTWNAHLARLERRGIRCPAASGAGGELISELGTPQANSPGKPGTARQENTCGGYSGYSEDTAADNVSSPRLRACGGYSEDTQNGA